MRIVLKISGESLKGEKSLDNECLNNVYKQIKNIKKDNELIIVIGGGNFWRGRNGLDIKSETSDYIGMMGTIMNSVALTSYLKSKNMEAVCYSALKVEKVAEKEDKEKIEKDLKDGKIVVLGGGCGTPGYSTDMTTITKAIDYNADTILMAKNIDGVYDKDPKKEKATMIKEMTHQQLLELSRNQGEGALTILDMEALILLNEHKIPVYIYKSGIKEDITKVLNGEIGTKIISK